MQTNQMNRKWLAIGISTVSVIIIILASLTNVVGYQTVQISQQNIIKERINQRELLFQTIVDIANTKEIQRIILKSQMSRGIFPSAEFPVMTKNQLRQMYFIGVILSKFISKSRIQSILDRYQYNNQDIQKEITTIIEKSPLLKGEIIQLQDSKCDCENDNIILWHFPILCSILYGLFLFSLLLFFINGGNIYSNRYPLICMIGFVLTLLIGEISYIFHCVWLIR